MSFKDIKDQDSAVRLLRNVLQRNRVPNAMLFWGPDGVGKQLTALAMACAVNCASSEDDACGECISCKKTLHGNHPDVRMVVPARKSRLIDLEALSQVTELASLRPYESTWRIVIIQDADRMTPPAQNRFLKTLEEPPGNSLFLLTSSYPRLLLPTIRSRCQQVRFRALRPESVVALLQELRGLPEEAALPIARLAQGQMTRALDLVDSEKRLVALSVTERLAQGDDPMLLAEEFAKALAANKKHIEASVKTPLDKEARESLTPEERERLKEEQLALSDALYKRDVLEYLYLMETWYRDQLVFAASREPGQVFNNDQIERLETEVSTHPEDKIMAIERSRVYLDRYINEERVFCDLFFSLAAP